MSALAGYVLGRMAARQQRDVARSAAAFGGIVSDAPLIAEIHRLRAEAAAWQDHAMQWQDHAMQWQAYGQEVAAQNGLLRQEIEALRSRQ